MHIKQLWKQSLAQTKICYNTVEVNCADFEICFWLMLCVERELHSLAGQTGNTQRNCSSEHSFRYLVTYYWLLYNIEQDYTAVYK